MDNYFNEMINLYSLKKIYEKARMMLINDPSIDVRIECVYLLNQLDESGKTCEIILSALEKEKNSYVIQALIAGLAYSENAAEVIPAPLNS